MEIKETKHYFIADGVKVHWGFKLLPGAFEAITLFGHVYDRREKDDLREYLKTYAGEVTINHERIHILQAQSFRTRYFAFYAIYLWWWIKGLFAYRFCNMDAYYSIPFEREAYYNETDFNYNKTSWREYID